MSRKTRKTEAKASFRLNEMAQTHGALASPSATKYLTGYDTAEASDYRAKIERMDSSELYNHAVSVGEVPIEDRDRLLKRLEDRFLSVQAASMPRQNVQMPISDEGREFIRKFMAGTTGR